MSLISIKCPNCGAKLKAKSSAVGQSLACPRCANMLTVQAPAGVDGDATAKPSFESDSLDDLLSGRPEPRLAAGADKPASPQRKTRSTKPDEDLQATVPSQSQGFGDLRSSGTSQPEKSGRLQKPAEPSPAESPALAQRPGQWQSAKSRQQKTVLLGIILGVGTLLVGSGLVYYFLTLPPTKIAEKPVEDPTTGDPTGDPGTATVDSPDPRQPTVPDSEDIDKDSTSQKADPPSTDSPSTDSTPTEPQVETGNPDQSTGIIPEVGTTEADADQGSNLDPQVAGQPKRPSQQTLMEAIDQIFGDDDVFQEKVLVGPQADREPTEDNVFGKVTVDDRGIRRRPSARIERPFPRELDTAAQLDVEIAGINHPSVTPLQLIALLENLSSIPIWIDAHSFRSAPLSLEQKQPFVSVKQSTRQILNQFQNFGFESVVTPLSEENEKAIGIRLYPAGSQELLTLSYPVPGTGPLPKLPAASEQKPSTEPPADPLDPNPNTSDDPLVEPPPADPLGQPIPEPQQELPVTQPQDPAAVALAEILKDYLYFGAWTESEEDVSPTTPLMKVIGTEIQVKAPLAVHYRVRRLLVQMSESNNPMPNKEETALDRQSIASLEDLRMGQPVTMNVYSPAPLRKVLGQFTEETGLAVLVDWPALLQEGWTPDTQVPWAVDSVMIRKALDDFVFDMGLAYQIVSPGVLRLTSQAALNDSLDVEVYPVGDLLGKEEQWNLLRSRLSQMLYGELRDYPSSYVNYFPQWNAVIARLPQPGHRRLAEYFQRVREAVTRQP